MPDKRLKSWKEERNSTVYCLRNTPTILLKILSFRKQHAFTVWFRNDGSVMNVKRQWILNVFPRLKYYLIISVNAMLSKSYLTETWSAKFRAVCSPDVVRDLYDRTRSQAASWSIPFETSHFILFPSTAPIFWTFFLYWRTPIQCHSPVELHQVCRI